MDCARGKVIGSVAIWACCFGLSHGYRLCLCLQLAILEGTERGAWYKTITTGKNNIGVSAFLVFILIIFLLVFSLIKDVYKATFTKISDPGLDHINSLP